MKSFIPLYTEINDLHVLTGSSLRTDNPFFHCFDMADANDLKIDGVGPHRASFYTLALNSGTEDLTYTLNKKVFSGPSNFLLCVAPGQIVKWEKKGRWLGYCTFFKSEFVTSLGGVNFLEHYPFFNLSETNLLTTRTDHSSPLAELFRHILEEQASDKNYCEEVIRSLFQAVLWRVRRIYEEVRQREGISDVHSVKAATFQFLVNEHFLSRVAVEDYADMLNVSPGHLAESVRKATGRSPKNFINQRRMEEAKYLLTYTSEDIAQIAFHLSFREPTHFNRFFKKESGVTPSFFRTSSRRTVSVADNG